ncbi:MAG: Tat pathway signal sequence domain protein, partial [Lacunisphaera sp.]
MSLTRREFVRSTVLAVAAAQLTRELPAATETPVPAKIKAPVKPGVANIHWLDDAIPSIAPGTTWGTPWPQGQHAAGTGFALRTAKGESVPVQSWPLAYWPDGTLKWTGHAIPANEFLTPDFELSAGTPAMLSRALTVKETADTLEIDTGVIRATVAKSGRKIIPSITRGGTEILRDGHLIMLRSDSPEREATQETFEGEINSIALESSGAVRAVVKITGQHASTIGARKWLPFVVRLYFYAGGEMVRLLHTIIYNGDPKKDAISGLGIRFSVPMRGALYDRHVRFSGQEKGLFAEAVRGITGLRRDPGEEVKAAQLAGRATPPLDTWAQSVSSRLQYVPAFADWTLFQPNCDGFEIRKRTREGFTWLGSARGSRAGGLGYVGSPEGGAAFGLRNFWQSNPAQLDIRNATGDNAEITA